MVDFVEPEQVLKDKVAGLRLLAGPVNLIWRRKLIPQLLELTPDRRANALRLRRYRDYLLMSISAPLALVAAIGTIQIWGVFLAHLDDVLALSFWRTAGYVTLAVGGGLALSAILLGGALGIYAQFLYDLRICRALEDLLQSVHAE